MLETNKNTIFKYHPKKTLFQHLEKQKYSFIND